jgi:hypothetical protein
MSEEEEERKLSRLEKRLVGNVNFDDQALYSLGFGTNIYYMLGTLDGCNSPTGCRQIPTRNLPWNF